MDSAYLDAGALVVDDPAKIWADVDLLVKVKEPIEPEFAFLHEGLILFTYLHLAADPALTAALVRQGRPVWLTRPSKTPMATCRCWPP